MGRQFVGMLLVATRISHIAMCIGSSGAQQEDTYGKYKSQHTKQTIEIIHWFSDKESSNAAFCLLSLSHCTTLTSTKIKEKKKTTNYNSNIKTTAKGIK